MSVKPSLLQSLKNTVPKPVVRAGMVREEVIRANEWGTTYLVVSAQDSAIDLTDWALQDKQRIAGLYLQYGAILFRGFAPMDQQAFQAFCQHFAGKMLDYTEPSTPRTRVGDKVYTSTEYPKDRSIPLHNEHSYTGVWPRQLWFYSVVPAASGGETPIADSALVYDLIPPALRDDFARTGIVYKRNYHPNLDLSWQHVFGTAQKNEVETHCLQNNISYTWGDDDRLQTRYVAQAVITHPITGKKVWFNQAHLFNILSLPDTIQSYFRETLGEDNIPRNSYHGDDRPVTGQEYAAITGAFEKAAISFTWQAGDLLWLDNLRFAHGRNPFDGDRKLLVAMADALTLADVAVEDKEEPQDSVRRQTSAYFVKKERPQSEEWLRYRLAGLYRILAMEKMDEGISGHISLKLPGSEERFLVNPFGYLFEEVTPENLVTVDLNGRVVDGVHPVNVAGFFIHATIHAARPEIKCIVHTHSPLGTVFTSLGKPILPIDQTSALFFEQHAIYDAYNGPVLDAEEGANLLLAAKDKHTLLLRNHGTLTMAPQLETAAMLMLNVERAYHVNLMAAAVGAPVLVAPEVARAAQEWITNPIGTQIEFDAYLRKAERHYPDLIAFKPKN